MKKQIQYIFMKVVNSNIILLVVFTILAILFSELLIYFQLSTFWQDKQNYEVVYYIGFWTPMFDALLVVFLVITIKNIYEKNLKEKEKELIELNNNLELRVKEGIEKNRIKDMELLKQARLAQMGGLISMIAHQWKQPLNAISSTTAILEVKLELESFDFTTKEGIKDSTKYLQQELENINEYI